MPSQPPWTLAFAMLFLLVLAGPATASPSPVAIEARSFDAEAVTLRGDAVAIDIRAPPDTPGATRLWLDAADLALENDYANSTYLARVPVRDEDHGAHRHELGPAHLEAASTTGAGQVHLLIVPLDGPLPLSATSGTASATAATSDPRMDNVVPYSPHAMVEPDVAGTTTWALRGSRLVVDGSFQLIAWGVDLDARGDGIALSLPTGERLTPAIDARPDAAGTQFSQQVHAFARDAHLEIDLASDAEANVYLGPSEVAWTGAAALLDVRGDVPQVDGLTARGADVTLDQGRLFAGSPQAGFIPVEVLIGAPAFPAQPATVAGLPLPGGAVVGWTLVPLLALAILVPGATLPWLRRVHGRRLAVAERALEEGRLSAAADGARRLAGSRWFAVDAAVLGAEACLQAGDPRQALAFLDGRPWKPSAQGLRMLLRARAHALQGETAAAVQALGTALDQAPDLRAMAHREPLLYGLLEGARPEGYT